MALTKNQKSLHWSLWKKVKKILTTQMYMEPKEADAHRHVLYEKALGYHQSLTTMNNREFDKVLSIFRSYTDPADLDAQMRQIDQPRTRAAYTLKQLQKKLNMTDEYLHGIAIKITKKSVLNCEAEDLIKIIAALNFHANRIGKSCQSNTPQEAASIQS